MVHGRLKSRTMRRVYVKTPGGNTVKRYLRRKPGRAQCADCGKFLHGIPNLARHQMRNLAKTERRPERPFGGMLCSSCSRERLRQQVFAQKQLIKQ